MKTRIRFDEDSPEWVPKVEGYHEMFIRAKMNYLNDFLLARGFISNVDINSAFGLKSVVDDLKSVWTSENGRLTLDMITSSSDHIILEIGQERS